MIELSYSTFGLTALDILEAIDVVDRAGYPGIELSFHRDQFNPFNLCDDDIGNLRKRLHSKRVKAACIATASHFFTPSRPHEPSLICPDLAGRRRRINLIHRGIQVARSLGVSLVTFGSGFIRAEHLANPCADPEELLVDSINRCLAAIHPDEDITLLVEPEPGMFIETIDQAITIVEAVNSPRFRLHLDLCHMYCSEQAYISALGRAAGYTRYLHVSDAQQGYNLKIMNFSEDLALDLDFASYLIYFADTADFLLVDRRHPVYFFDDPVPPSMKIKVNQILDRVGLQTDPQWVDYNQLYAGRTEIDNEIFVYLISMPGLSFDVLERAKPIIAYLRGANASQGKGIIEKMVANTLTGVVHFHEIPGEGSLDFSASFRALTENSFSGYASVELYHHVESWEKALEDSYQHLSKFI